MNQESHKLRIIGQDNIGLNQQTHGNQNSKSRHN
jgi:hypothetical protein